MKQTSQTLADGLQLLRVLHQAGSPLLARQVAEVMELDRTKVYRLLNTLLAHGFVRQLEGGRYVLTPLLASLAPTILDTLRRVALGTLTSLASQTALTAHLSVGDGEVVTALRVVNPPQSDVFVAYREGSTHAIDQGAAGVAILAGRTPLPEGRDDLQATARRGYAVTSGELQTGATGLASRLRVEAFEASIGVIGLGEFDESVVANFVLTARDELEAIVAAQLDPADAGTPD